METAQIEHRIDADLFDQQALNTGAGVQVQLTEARVYTG
jgi:hypothetical protein